MGETLTVKEVLEKTVELLNATRVPMSEMESIGMNIIGAVRNLNAVLEVLEKAKAEKPEKPDDEGAREAPAGEE